MNDVFILLYIVRKPCGVKLQYIIQDDSPSLMYEYKLCFHL